MKLPQRTESPVKQSFSALSLHPFDSGFILAPSPSLSALVSLPALAIWCLVLSNSRGSPPLTLVP